jgi:hypothetical protein
MDLISHEFWYLLIYLSHSLFINFFQQDFDTLFHTCSDNLEMKSKFYNNFLSVCMSDIIEVQTNYFLYLKAVSI